jgi:hypothetical protein
MNPDTQHPEQSLLDKAKISIPQEIEKMLTQSILSVLRADIKVEIEKLTLDQQMEALEKLIDNKPTEPEEQQEVETPEVQNLTQRILDRFNAEESKPPAPIKEQTNG